MNTLVVTVAWPGPRTARWLAAQARALAAFTAGRYETLALPVGAAGGVPVGLPAVRPAADPVETRRRALAAALAAFADRPGFDGYLLVDCDAMPCRPAWDGFLRTALAADPPRPARAIAALCRAELLEPWAHPGVLYLTRPDAVTAAEFAPAPAFRPGIGPVVALGGTFASRCDWLPLVRTGGEDRYFFNSGVYGGLFYHHNWGCRPAACPVAFHGPWDATQAGRLTPSADRAAFAAVTTDPVGFLSSLGRPPARAGAVT